MSGGRRGAEDSRPSGELVEADRGADDGLADGGPAVGTGPGLDLRLIVPALAAWAVVFVLLWSGASAAVTLVVVAVSLVGAVVAQCVGARGVRRLRGMLATVGVLVALATMALWAHGAARTAGLLVDLAADGATVTVEGTVSADPRPLPGRKGAAEPQVRVMVHLLVDRITGRGESASASTPILVIGDERWAALQWQQRVRAVGRLVPAAPGDEVVAVLRPTGSAQLVDEPGVVAQAAAFVRARFRQATARLPPDAAGLVPALVVGDTSATPPELTDAMLATGLSHLSAVSGSNIAIVAATALLGCRALGVRRRWRPSLVLVVLAGFVVLARPEPSVLRATLMGVVGLLGLGVSRRRTGLPALGAAVVALLVWDPWLARSYGFALSTLATLGLLVLAGPWGAALGRRLPRRLAGWGPVIAVPIAAQAMCAPVLVLRQGSVSLVSIPANLLAEPLVAPTTIGGVLVAGVSVVSVEAGSVLAWAAALPALGIGQIARGGARLPWGELPWPAGAPGAFALAGLLAGLVVSGPWARHRMRSAPLVAAGVGVLLVALAVPTRDVAWPLPGWQIVMCDVGQGDALVLPTQSGRGILVDTGPDPTLVVACLDRLGIEVLDAVILTHFHADHVDGLVGVLRRGGVRQVFTSPVAEPAYEADHVQAQAAAFGVPSTPLYAGDELTWGTVRARVWWPARVLHEGSVPNNASLVLAVDTAGTRVLMLGDVERDAAAAVLATLRRDPEMAGQVDVVKVAHHGSANRLDDLYAVAAAPVGLISVGVDNDYGHPAASTLGVLTTMGYRLERTDLDGDVAVARSADGALLVARRGR